MAVDEDTRKVKDVLWPISCVYKVLTKRAKVCLVCSRAKSTPPLPKVSYYSTNLKRPGQVKGPALKRMSAQCFLRSRLSTISVRRRFSSTSVPRQSTNEKIYIKIYEEPLGIPAGAGHGYFQGKPGVRLGPNGRFTIQVKLGFGTTSSVWLAKDAINNNHVALKILNGYASQMNFEHKLRELDVHQRFCLAPPSIHDFCSRMITHFTHTGMDDDGEHLCLALELFQADINSVMRLVPAHEFLPIHIVKRILRHTLKGLEASHRHGIVHTDGHLQLVFCLDNHKYYSFQSDLKPDNIRVPFDDKFTAEILDEWVRAHPPRIYPPTKSLDKMATTYVSECLPLPSIEELAGRTFKLADFSNAQLCDDHTTDHITPLGLRPPEIMLGGPWDETVDIWTFGCIVFTLLTRLPLFYTGVEPRFRYLYPAGTDFSDPDVQHIHVLFQTAYFTQQIFPPALLEIYPHSARYFNEQNSLKLVDLSLLPYSQWPLLGILASIRTSSPLKDSDVEGAVKLILQCLKLYPTERPSARALIGSLALGG